MRHGFLGGVFVVFSSALIGAAPAAAQSLEENYAKLCSDAETAKNETCVALRQALMEKLQAQNGIMVDSAHAESMRDTPSNSAQAHASDMPADWSQRWGLWLDMIGRQWRSSAGDPLASFSYRWKVPGEELEMVASVLDRPPHVLEDSWWRWNAPSQRIELMFKPPAGGGLKESVLVERDGSLTTLSTVHTVERRSTTRRLPDGSFERLWQRKSGEEWVGAGREHFTEYTPAMMAQDRRRLREEAELAAAEEARRKQNGNHGLFGAMVGAAVGAYAGSAAGLDTAQTADLMMRGAAAASPGSPIAQGLAQGWAEETAKNEAMQQSMDDAIDRGLADGAAEYARQQEDTQIGSGNYSSGATTGGNDRATGSAAASTGSAGGTTAVVLMLKGFRVPITPGATSNEMCFARTTVGPISTDSQHRWGEAVEAVAGARDRFLNACSRLGDIGTYQGFDEMYLDEQAESAYAKFQADKWKHEVTVR